MVTVKAFRALRPVEDSIFAVNSPPYDVVSQVEAAEILKENPDSFLKVIKPEASISCLKNLNYQQLAEIAAENLRDMIKRKVMLLEPNPCFYIYQQENKSYQRTGIVACLSTEDYQRGAIKQHEKIRIETWQERVKHIQITRAHTGCALIVYQGNSHIEEIIQKEKVKKNLIYDFVSDDSIRNYCWKVNQDYVITSLQNAFQEIPSFYIADGHHRVAAAAEVARIESKEQQLTKGTDKQYAYFPAVLVPHYQIRILGYHRLIKDLQRFSPNWFLNQLKKNFQVEKITVNQPFLPSQKYEFGMKLASHWYRLSVKQNNIIESQSVVDRLDVSILQNQILEPLLGIKDPQKSKKIEFIGGKDATLQLTNKTRRGNNIAFTLYPTSMDEVIAVSDNNEIMPPKSTWFEPKIRSGIFVHQF
ncbi:MAG: DUF1015 domain-containing protein [Atribacterota bacterium]